MFLAVLGADETQIEASFRAAIAIAKEQKSISLAKRAEATYAEYHRVARNMVDHLEGPRNFVVCKPLHRKVEDFLGLNTLRALGQLHYPSHSLAKHGIRHTDDRSVAHRRMGH